MAKHPTVEPIRNPTLFEMDKLEQPGRLVNSSSDRIPSQDCGRCCCNSCTNCRLFGTIENS